MVIRSIFQRSDEYSIKKCIACVLHESSIIDRGKIDELVFIFILDANIHEFQVYMNDDEPYFNLKEHIKVQTDVMPESQILIMNNQEMEEKVGSNSLVKGFPPTTNTTPIFLYSIDNNNVTIPGELESPKFPTFPNAVSVENDASLSKMACSVGHECKRRIEMYSRMDQLMKCSVEQFIVVLRDTISKLIE